MINCTKKPFTTGPFSNRSPRNTLANKESLKVYHDKLKQEVETADNSDFENIRKKLKKQITDNQKELEKITKKYNSILSMNVKRRSEINACRKERTLYDHIFKTLEYQILDQESRLFRIIKKNKKKDDMLKESTKNLENINELVSKSNYDDFYKLIEEEKRKYLVNLENLKNEVRGSKEIYKSMFIQRKTINVNKMMSMKRSQESNQNSLRESALKDVRDLNRKIEFMESLAKDFKFHTCDEDLENIKIFFSDNDEYNEGLYKDFCELENQFEDLKAEYKDNVRLVEKFDNHSVSTRVTVQKDFDSEQPKDIKKELQECTDELHAILVSL